MNRLVRNSLKALRLYDLAIDFKFWMQGTQKKYREFYSQLISEGDLCFDVGANVGRRVDALLKLGAKVIAIEPLPQSMRVLEKKYAANPDVVLVNKAVGKSKGTATMYVSDVPSLCSLSSEWIDAVRSSGRYARSQWNKTITVPLETMDSLIEKYGLPALAKIDVEGYEQDVIEGLSTPIRNISFEFTPERLDSALKTVEHLSSLGNPKFNICLSSNPFRWCLEHWPNAESFSKELASIAKNNEVADIFVKFEI
ncbi:MAG: FkbM family methyltransferase [Planctomycetota bacterium]|jgi:FkbM family methyltransferase